MKKLIILRAKNGQLYFVLKSRNNQVIATGETYKNKASIKKLHKNNFPAFEILDHSHLPYKKKKFVTLK